METKTFTDGDLFVAMEKAFNMNVNFDPMEFEAIDKLEEEVEEPLRWNGAIMDYNGMDVKNQKHPFFEK